MIQLTKTMSSFHSNFFIQVVIESILKSFLSETFSDKSLDMATQSRCPYPGWSSEQFRRRPDNESALENDSEIRDFPILRNVQRRATGSRRPEADF